MRKGTETNFDENRATKTSMAALDFSAREPSLPDGAEPASAGKLSMHLNEEVRERANDAREPALEPEAFIFSISKLAAKEPLFLSLSGLNPEPRAAPHVPCDPTSV